jgi:hypothetical protein
MGIQWNAKDKTTEYQSRANIGKRKAKNKPYQYQNAWELL